VIRCPVCRSAPAPVTRGGTSFPACPPCQLAWLSEDDLGERGAHLHSHRTPSRQRCLTCGGEQSDRAVVMAHGMADASHCPACRVVTFALPALLESFSRSRPRPRTAAPASPTGTPGPARRKIDERDRVFAFLLALPLELSEERDTVPIGVAALVGGCTAAFVLDLLTDGALRSAFSFSAAGGYVRTVIGSLTSAFIHLDPLHLLGNMYFLYAFGRLLERRLGSVTVLWLFAASAITASLAFWAVHFGQDAKMAGASGAVSGILGCYLALFPGRMVGVSLLLFVLRVPAVLYLGWWLLVQLVSVPEEQGVAYSAHAGGALAGFIWALVIRTKGDYDPE
jgi:membrane associated rhomboid family serine protease/Zn-finger nucleic acid-binding protein